MVNCINKNTKEFKELLEATKLPSLLLEMKISKWQDTNGLDSFPITEDIINSDEVNYTLKSIDILQSDKAKNIFEKGNKNSWSLDKILTELQIPKEQKQLLLDIANNFYKVWHASNTKIESFNPDNVDGYFSSVKKGSPKAVFFTAAKAPKESFLSKRDYQQEFNVKMNNPLIVDTKTGYSRNVESFKELVDRALSNGHDGVIVKNVDDNGFNGDVYISLNSDNIFIDLQEQLALELASKYSYSVEINTAKEKEGLIKDGTEFKVGEDYYYSDPNRNVYKILYSKDNGGGSKNISKQEFEDARQNSKPTQHYSNLTVPGGTNYTEQEIATPAITPSIKGHAQFATDKGIGWFRSDEESTGDKLDKYDVFIDGIGQRDTKTRKEAEDFIKLHSKKWNRKESDYNIIETKYNIRPNGSKTRRILEVQSDLFQKGRDRNDLISSTKAENISENHDSFNLEGVDYGKMSIPPGYGNREFEYYKQINDSPEEIITEEEYNNAKSKLGKKAPIQKNSKNKFLQLLNKNSNWVTFFVKSIIQDSAKKGYEKVLFPSGNTASKVEGHTTLKEFKKEKEDRIRVLEYQTKPFVAILNTGHPYGYYNTIEEAENSIKKNNLEKKLDKIIPNAKLDSNINEIKTLKQELKRVETEGFAALKPIYNFYENTVTNILNKTYGKIQDYSNTPIKSGVDSIFEENKELSKIGSKQLYSAYLDTIFPDSKVKDIVYHGSKEKFDTVDVSKSKFQKGFYFAKDKSIAEGYGNTLPLLVDSKNIQIQHFAHFGYYVDSVQDLEKQLNKLKQLKKEGDLKNSLALQLIDITDEIIFFNTKEEKEEHRQRNSGWENVEKYFLENKLKEIENLIKSINEQGEFDTMLTHNDDMQLSLYAVGKSEQIHILGSKQDIEGFKNFVKESSKSKVFKITDEYGNTWNEVTINSKRDESTIFMNKVDFSKIIDDKQDTLYPDTIVQDKIVVNENKTLFFGNDEITSLSADDVLKRLISSDIFENSDNVAFFLERTMNLLNKSGAELQLISPSHKHYDQFEEDVTMLYDSIENKIYVTETSFNNFSAQTLASAFIHEIVHSTTVQAYFNPKTFEEKEFKRFIDEAYEQYKSLATKRNSKGELSYGFTNQAEFIAEIFSNPDFRNEITSIEKNFIQKFIDSIRRLFEMVRNGFNNDLIKSAVLFKVVDDFSTRNKSQWKGTRIYDPRYDKYGTLANKVENSTLQDKIDNLVNSQINNISQIMRRATAQKNKYGAKNQIFINTIVQLDREVNDAVATDKLKAINHYVDFMVEQIDRIQNEIGRGSKTTKLEQLDTIERYKSYLGASDMLQPIMDTLNDTRVNDLTKDEQDFIEQIQEKLRNVAGNHLNILSKFRTHTTDNLRKELNSSYYSENAVYEFKQKVAKEYPKDSPISKNEWVNQQLIERKSELDEYVQKDIDNVLDGLSVDIDGFDTNLLTAVNTQSRLIQLVMKVITKMKSKIDSLIRDNDFKLDSLYQNLMKEKKKYDITNLYDISESGEVFVKSEYSIKFRDTFLNDYSKLLDEVTELKTKHRKDGFNDIEINQFADVNAIYRKIADWKKEHTTVIKGQIFPHPKYKNKLNFSKAEQAIYDEYLSIAKNSEKVFGHNNSLIKTAFKTEFYSLPYATVTKLERVMTGRTNIKDTVKQSLSEITDWKIDDIDNSEEMYRQDGTKIFNIPVMFRNNISKVKEEAKYKQAIKEQSYDLLTLMRLEHYNQTNFKIKSENDVLLNAFVDVAKDKKYLKTKPGSRRLVQNIFGITDKNVTFEGVESNTYKRIQSIVEQSLYNKFYEESFKVAGKDINKIVQSFNKHTAFLGMSLNHFNAPVNVLNAEYQTFLLKIAGDIDSNKMLEAHKVYSSDLHNILADAGRPNKQSLVNQLNLLTDVFGGLTHEQNDFIKNTILKSVADPGVLQIFQNGGEHMVQSVLNIALLKSIKVMNNKAQYINKEGEIVSEKEAATLFDMVDQNVETKQINFNDKFTYTDKSTITKWNEGGFENVRLFVKKKIFDTMGEYDKNFQTEIQKHWWGQLIMMYKKFIIPLGLARYRGVSTAFKAKDKLQPEDRIWNEALQQYEEGFYTSTFRFIGLGIVQMIKQKQFDILSKNWNELSEYEKGNVKKGLTELAVLVMLQMIIVPLLVGMAGDDDDEYLMFLAMTARRIEQELSFYTDPNDAYKVTTNPIASMRLLGDLINVGKFTFSPGLWFSSTDDGTPRAYKALEKVIIPTSFRPDKNAKSVLQGMNRGLVGPYEEGIFYQLINSK